MLPLPQPVLRLWRAGALLAGTAAGIIPGSSEIALRANGVDLPFPPLVIPLTLGVVVAAVSWRIAGLRYRAWGFELTDTWITAQWGVIVHHTATIPRNRVQTLTSNNGPIDRIVGLTSVTVHTAGVGAPNIVIPHLNDSTVDWLRDELARGRVS